MDIFDGKLFGGFSYDKPELIHLETHTFKLKLKNADGTAADLSGFVAAECAVNNSFDHNYNELMAYAGSTAAVITDAAGGEIEITLDCNTLKFGEVVRFKSQMAYIEINLFDTSAKMTRVLLDRVPCMPHVRNNEGAPVSGDPGYYNKTEVDVLISGVSGAVESVNGKTGVVELNAADVGAIADPETAGTTGQVLTQTANGPAWESSEQIVPVTATSFSPQSGIYYTQIAASGDINYTFSFGTAPVTFEFWITKTSSGAWNFATASGIDCWWEKDGVFAPENPPPDMTSTGKVYALTFRWDGAQLLGNLTYSKAVSA